MYTFPICLWYLNFLKGPLLYINGPWICNIKGWYGEVECPVPHRVVKNESVISLWFPTGCVNMFI